MNKAVKMPKVSVIMGVYNCEATLSKCIDSIINQTYPNWELVMCDDASQDRSLQIMQDYQRRYPAKIRLIANKENLSLAPTLNRCIVMAAGKYVARQDGDDYSSPQRLEQQVAFLEKNQDYDLVAANMISFDDSGVYGVRQLISEPKIKNLAFGTPFCHATVMIKTDVLRGLGGYSVDISRKQVEDYELWFRFFAKGYRGYNLSQPLYYVREDRNAYSRKSLRRRLNEARVIWTGCSMVGLPFYYRSIVLKPIIAGLVPRKLLKHYHNFRQQKAAEIYRVM